MLMVRPQRGRPRWPRRAWPLTFLAVMLAAVAGMGRPSSTASIAARGHSSPPPGGYFSILPVGAWSRLPGDAACASAVHRSSWEPRPDNYGPNHTMPRAQAVHDAFAARTVSTDGSYAKRWDSWLLPRVDGQFTGTTDEIFQWGACKWGLPDDLLRAIAVRESTWYQYEIYPSKRPVNNWGSGDLFTVATRAGTIFCNGLATQRRDYQRDYGAGLCPKTFSIMGVMSWEDPSWGKMPGNQNGTYPFNRRSTAFAVDYIGSQLRGCYEGWEKWLANTGTESYSAGRIWGCVGAWYSGAWRDADANGYISRVQHAESHHRWLKPDWSNIKPSCSAEYGCPRGS
jgi:hypothetical protein